MYLGPHFAGHLGQIMVCQMDQSKFKGGHFDEKIANFFFWAWYCGLFCQKRGLPFDPEWTDFKNFQQFPVQNLN